MLTVIGGMGPDAGLDFMYRLFLPALKEALGDRYRDQTAPAHDYKSRPFDDRTAALLAERRGNPEPARRVARQLQEVIDQAYANGSTMMAIVCNTAHAFLMGSDTRRALDLRGMRLIDIRMAALSQVPAGAKVALMATSGTIELEVYASQFEGDLILPDEDFQVMVMEGIYDGVKAKNLTLAAERFSTVARHLSDKGATDLIMGCTEIPLALQAFPGLNLVDPNRALAHACVRAMLS
jgi:aspartate racemase